MPNTARTDASSDTFFVRFGDRWLPLSAEAASFWFVVGRPVRMDGPFEPPPVNQNGIYVRPVRVPWE